MKTRERFEDIMYRLTNGRWFQAQSVKIIARTIREEYAERGEETLLVHSPFSITVVAQSVVVTISAGGTHYSEEVEEKVNRLASALASILVYGAPVGPKASLREEYEVHHMKCLWSEAYMNVYDLVNRWDEISEDDAEHVYADAHRSLTREPGTMFYIPDFSSMMLVDTKDAYALIDRCAQYVTAIMQAEVVPDPYEDDQLTEDFLDDVQSYFTDNLITAFYKDIDFVEGALGQ